MLVAERGDTYRIVGQTEHATVAGRLADHWGTAEFEPPEPSAVVRAATHTHDNGWAPWDLAPHLDGDGDPVNLFSVDAEDWREFYERGIENVVRMDPYAGLLVSMHGSGVRQQRYGTVPEMPNRAETYAGFIEAEEARQRELTAELADHPRYGASLDDSTLELLDALHTSGGYDGSNPVWRNYRLLQIWDRLAIHLCRDPRLEPGEFSPTPTSPNADDTTLTIQPTTETEAHISPYPFDIEPLVVTIRERVIPNRTYQDRIDVTNAFYDAEQRAVDYVLRP